MIYWFIVRLHLCHIGPSHILLKINLCGSINQLKTLGYKTFQLKTKKAVFDICKIESGSEVLSICMHWQDMKTLCRGTPAPLATIKILKVIF